MKLMKNQLELNVARASPISVNLASAKTKVASSCNGRLASGSRISTFSYHFKTVVSRNETYFNSPQSRSRQNLLGSRKHV